MYCLPAIRKNPMPKQSHTPIVEFGAELDSILSERGWNQTLLSAATDPEVSQGQISNYRYGRRKPKAETIEVIARALAPENQSQADAGRLFHQINSRLRHAAGLRRAAGTTATQFPESIDEPAPMPMMTFVEQQLRLLPHGTVNDLTAADADRLVSELEELAALRIAQVQRQGKA